MKILDKMRLDGKAAFITGGARGIGKCLAYGLAEAGADIVIADIDMAEAEKTAAAIAADTGVRAIAIRCNITVQADVDGLIERMMQEFGHVDIACCNAGICIDIPAEELSFADWYKVIDINLNGTFRTAQAAGKVMLQQGKGSIICTASMNSRICCVPQPESAYNASKAGVVMLVKSLAVEWAARGVRVNAISPGYMETELVTKSPELAPLIEGWKQLSPMRRIGNPNELQSIAVYLAGDTSSFTTGAEFTIDGAYTCF